MRRLYAKCRGRARTIRRLDKKLRHLYETLSPIIASAGEAEERWRAVVIEANDMRERIERLNDSVVCEGRRADALWEQIAKVPSDN